MHIIYEGPSNYDDTPIVVIATNASKNPKTGNMWQTWILRQDIAPHHAVKNGDDSSVCGRCPLRPLSYKANKLKKKCYVQTWQAPRSVWEAYHRGSYQRITPDQFREILQGAGIRLGSYGDPASVPFELWQSIGVGTGEFTHTGYTHGYLMPNFDPRHLQFCMISLDPITELMPELPQGRTFRVINAIDQVRQGEILCPASKEQGNRTTCAKCGLCAGLTRKAKNIAIVMH